MKVPTKSFKTLRGHSGKNHNQLTLLRKSAFQAEQKSQ